MKLGRNMELGFDEVSQSVGQLSVVVFVGHVVLWFCLLFEHSR